MAEDYLSGRGKKGKQSDLKRLTKEFETIKKLQADLNAEKDKGNKADKEALKNIANLLNLANGRVDKMGQLRGKTKEVYNEYKGLLDVSSSITKDTNNRGALLKEANELAKFQGKGTKMEADISKQMVGVRKQLLNTSTAEKIQSMDMAGIDKEILEIEDRSKDLRGESQKKVMTLLGNMKTQRKMLGEQQDYLNMEDKIRDATIGKLKTMSGGMRQMIMAAKNFAKVMLANPIFLLAAVIVGLIALMKKFVTDSLALRDGLGASVTQAASLNAELQGARMEAFLMGYDVNQIAGELQETFGTLEGVTSENVRTLGQFEKILGIATKDAAAVAREFQVMSGESFDTGLNFVKTTAELAKANKVAPGMVMKDIAENSEMFAEFGKDGGQNLAKAAVQARKLGVSLGTTAKIANSLLDFESSIEKEMEASMMIGRQLNFNRARELALSGDVAGATADIVKQLGGASEIQKMNVLQRRALADSIGVSVDELNRLATGKVELLPPEKSVEEMLLDKMQQLIEALEKFKVFVTDMGESIVEYYQMILNKIFGESGLGQSISNLATKLFDDIKKIFGGDGTFGEKLGAALATTLVSVVTSLPEILFKLEVGIRNALIGIFIAVTDFAGSFVEGILNTLGGIFGFDNIGTVVKDIFIGFRDAIVNVFSNILQFVIDMIYKVPFAEKVLGEKPVIGTSAEGQMNAAVGKIDYGSKEAMGDVAKREMGDLNAEQQKQLATAIQQGQVQALNDSLGEKQDKQSEEMREMIMVLNAIAKNTGMTQQEIINLTKE